jgi:2-amino-4-hydroxy-6-hydroxymethyldihydropteridine diphosphokinase
MRYGIAFGSNLGDRLAHLKRARELLLTLPGFNADNDYLCSPLFETEPVNCPPGSTAFFNTVMEVDSDLPPLLVLGLLHGVEMSLGRPLHHTHHAPRTIDLDILYADGIVLRLPELTIPHPRLAKRRFVLEPLAAIRPDLVLPGQRQSVADLLQALDDPHPVLQVSPYW